MFSKLNMTPINTLSNLSYGISANSKLFGDCNLPDSRMRHLSNSEDFCIRKFMSFIFFSLKYSRLIFQDMARMMRVPLRCSVLKITQSWVIFYSVFMIDLVPLWRRPYKITHNQNMDPRELWNAVFTQRHLDIAVSIVNMFKNASLFAISSSKSAHGPGSANFVNSFISDHWFPRFHTLSIPLNEEVCYG